MSLKTLISIIFITFLFPFINMTAFAQQIISEDKNNVNIVEPETIQLIKDPVIFDNIVLMYIGSTDLVSARHRAIEIKSNINNILKAPKTPEKVSILKENDYYLISIDNTVITKVTSIDAEVNNIELLKLTQVWKSNILSFIEKQYNITEKITPKIIIINIVFAFIALLVILGILEFIKKKISTLIIFFFLKSIKKFNRFLDELRNKKIQEYTEANNKEEIDILMVKKQEQEIKLGEKSTKISEEVNFIITFLIRIIQIIAIFAFSIYVLYNIPVTNGYVSGFTHFILSITLIIIESFSKWFSAETTWESLGRVIFISIATAFILYIINIIVSGLENIIQIVLEDDKGRAKRTQTISKIVKTTIKILVIIFAIILVMSELGIDITPIIAGASIIGLAISFGSQSLVKDIINGIFILIENQFGIGDVVSISSTSGLVEDMTLRVTILRDLSGHVHIIPNGQISTVTVMTKEWSRAHLDIGIAYKEDIDTASRLIKETADQMFKEFPEKIISEATILGVNNLGESSIDIKMIMTTQPGEQWFVEREFRRRIKYLFDQNNIEIPFPHRTLYIQKNK